MLSNKSKITLEALAIDGADYLNLQDTIYTGLESLTGACGDMDRCVNVVEVLEDQQQLLKSCHREDKLTNDVLTSAEQTRRLAAATLGISEDGKLGLESFTLTSVIPALEDNKRFIDKLKDLIFAIAAKVKEIYNRIVTYFKRFKTLRATKLEKLDNDVETLKLSNTVKSLAKTVSVESISIESITTEKWEGNDVLKIINTTARELTHMGDNVVAYLKSIHTDDNGEVVADEDYLPEQGFDLKIPGFNKSLIRTSKEKVILKNQPEVISKAVGLPTEMIGNGSTYAKRIDNTLLNIDNILAKIQPWLDNGKITKTISDIYKTVDKLDENDMYSKINYNNTLRIYTNARNAMLFILLARNYISSLFNQVIDNYAIAIQQAKKNND